ncbi:MAG: hypothetical protein CVU39_03375 [Chloroflexi bacterium HGW-Chloroflexi-10]|nr:MAG: hypothetical protein CVU39_03375 [Chloroflexi bacterium HGW-Chloroflexi-10]
MPKIAIITDSTAQFSNPSFPGKDQVRLIPFGIKIGDKTYPEGIGITVSEFPTNCSIADVPTVIIPTPNQIADLFISLLKNFNELLVLTNSLDLTSVYQNSLEAVELIQGKTMIQVINSQTISTGLGLLVQMAAELVSNGATLADTERHIRQAIPHIYTLFCSPCLSYLAKNEILEETQAAVGEILNLHPIFSLEEGKPSALCKVRNFRHAQDYFQEFIEEYDELQHISLIKGVNTQGLDNRLFRQFVQEYFPDTPFSEHRLNPFLAGLFGPKSLGLIVVEKPYTLSG